jgi:hypothetical protein
MERPSGMRVMQTFRKLPMTMPKRKKKREIIRIDCAIGEEGVESLKFKVAREQSIEG